MIGKVSCKGECTMVMRCGEKLALSLESLLLLLLVPFETNMLVSRASASRRMLTLPFRPPTTVTLYKSLSLVVSANDSRI